MRQKDRRDDERKDTKETLAKPIQISGWKLITLLYFVSNLVVYISSIFYSWGHGWENRRGDRDDEIDGILQLQHHQGEFKLCAVFFDHRRELCATKSFIMIMVVTCFVWFYSAKIPPYFCCGIIRWVYFMKRLRNAVGHNTCWAKCFLEIF